MPPKENKRTELIAAARLRQNVAAVDTTYDDQISAALALALSIVETYLDRKLEYLVDDVHIALPGSLDALVRRYPIESVKSITNHSGAIVFDAKRGIVPVPYSNSPVEVVYTGGYKPGEIPSEIEYVLMKLFDVLAPDFGLPTVGQVSGSTIQSITVPDVGTVRYSESASGSTSLAGIGLLTGTMRGLLDPYRAESAVGAG